MTKVDTYYCYSCRRAAAKVDRRAGGPGLAKPVCVCGRAMTYAYTEEETK